MLLHRYCILKGTASGRRIGFGQPQYRIHTLGDTTDNRVRVAIKVTSKRGPRERIDVVGDAFEHPLPTEIDLNR